MPSRKLLLGSLVAATLGFSAAPAGARTDVGVYLDFGPPALPVEVVAAPRVGFVWVPGFWDWRYNRYHWVAGHHVRGHPGYHYVASRWVQHGSRWGFERGYWGHVGHGGHGSHSGHVGHVGTGHRY